MLPWETCAFGWLFYLENSMSIKLEGTLVVRHINGSRGGFSVGDLLTHIGSFKVKDALLDQYEEGKYQGAFLVSQIFPSSYVWQGKVITEVRANISEIFLEEAEEKAVPAGQSEPDPVSEEPVAHPVEQPSSDNAAEQPSVATAGDAEHAAPTADLGNPDAVLFGIELHTLVVAGQPVKLDPTIDRGQFRNQRDRLKELGYGFQSATQTWESRA